MPLVAPPVEWLTSPPTMPDNAIVIFYADIDPMTGEMWCSDCRRVKSTVDWMFNGDDKPLAYVIYVGSRVEWKLPAQNHFRTDYKINGVPTMVKFRKGIEVCRLDENGILDSNSLARFFKS